MSRSTLRRIRRLKADYAPIIAEYERLKKEWKESLPSKAEDHLLRIIALFEYGDPRIDEPLDLAYRRALTKLGTPEGVALVRLRENLEREPPAGDIKTKISARLRQIPNWLIYFCSVKVSMDVLGIKGPALPKKYVLNLKVPKSDRDAWPFLPQGVLEPRRDQILGKRFYSTMSRFYSTMSLEELWTYIEIRRRPEEEWTRHEHRFVHAMFDRDPIRQKEDAADDSDRLNGSVLRSPKKASRAKF
jgi:hypothetical protein